MLKHFQLLNPNKLQLKRRKNIANRQLVKCKKQGNRQSCLKFFKLFHPGGGSRIFSRGGGEFSKNFPKFWRPFFFKVDQIDFSSSPKALFCPYFGKIFCAAGKFLKKQSKKPFLNTFWKILTKKSRFFFGARSPSKLVYIGAKGAFKKILGSVGQKWISEKVSKGGPFGSAGGRISEGGGRPPPPPPLNPPLLSPSKTFRTFQK